MFTPLWRPAPCHSPAPHGPVPMLRTTLEKAAEIASW